MTVSEFMKGMRVWWRLKSGIIKRGICITDEDQKYVFVAVDSPADEPRPVVHCYVEWLHPEEKYAFI